MSKLIIDAANASIFFTVITNNNIYNISHENNKTNYEKLMILINKFLESKALQINDISTLYVNRGPGSFAGIRNSLSTVKAIHVAKKIDYYCFSFKDFSVSEDAKYENIPKLCDKFNIKKNLINPIYIS
jgi:tRNA A37 threonylcarbamoyladenosine modification protein TsaB